MRSTVDPGGAVPQVAAGQPRRRVDGRLVVLLVLIALSTRGMLAGSLDPVALRTWTTVFVAIVVQALPFLVLGVLVSGAITALVSPAVLERLLPRSPLLAVPGAALAGTALPGCECASVPIAGRLLPAGCSRPRRWRSCCPPRRSTRSSWWRPRWPSPASRDGPGPVPWLAGDLDRGRAGRGRGWATRPGWSGPASASPAAGGPRWLTFTSAARHDLWDAGGWLVVGAAAAATLQVLVPRSLVLAVADQPVLSVLALGGPGGGAGDLLGGRRVRGRPACGSSR